MATAFEEQLDRELDQLSSAAIDFDAIERRRKERAMKLRVELDVGLEAVVRAVAGNAELAQLFSDVKVQKGEVLDLEDLEVEDLDFGVVEDLDLDLDLDLDDGGGGASGGDAGGDLEDLDLDLDLGLDDVDLDAGDLDLGDDLDLGMDDLDLGVDDIDLGEGDGDLDLDLDLDMDLPDVSDLPEVDDLNVEDIGVPSALLDAGPPPPAPLPAPGATGAAAVPPMERQYSLLPASRRAPTGKIRKKEENLDATSDAYTFKVDEESTQQQIITTPRREERDLSVRTPTEGMKKLVLTVFISGNTSKKLSVSADFSMKDIVMLMAKKLGLWQVEFFHIATKTSSGGDCWIAEETTVQDLGLDAKPEPLYLKIKYIKWPLKLVDDVARSLFYLQIKDCVVGGVWPCSHKLSMLLAAHQLQETLGDFKPFQHRPGYLGEAGIMRYLPQSVIRTAPIPYLEERIYQSYSRLSGMSNQDACNAYVKHAQSIQTYGSTSFLVKDPEGKSRKLAIAEDGIFYSIAADIDKFDFFSFKRLTGWQQAENGTRVEIDAQNPTAHVAVEAVNHAEAAHIIELLCAYYTFLLEVDPTDLPLVRLPMRPADLPNPLMFEKPNSLLKRNLSDQTYSRLELLKELYVDGLRVKSVVPNEKLLLQVDDCIDQEIVLEELNMEHTGTGPVELETISEAILSSLHFQPRASDFFEENLSLSRLNFSRNPVAKTTAGLNAIGAMLEAQHFKLKHLALRGCKLSHKHIEVLGQFLAKNKHLESIDVECNDIKDKGVSGIVKPLKGQENCSSFNFNDNNLTSQVCFLLAQMLAKNPNVQELFIGSNKIDDKGISHIMEGIKRNKSLTTFDISRTQFSANAGRTLIKLLEGSFMKRLYVSDNKLGSSWGSALVKVLQSGCGLAVLHCANTGLGAKNTKGVLEALKTCRGLKDLVISGNEVDKKGVPDLVEVLRTNHPLTHLGVAKCGFSKTLMVNIAQALEPNANLTSLDISGNVFKSVEAAQAWARLLTRNRTLVELNLSSCGLAGDVLAAFLPGLGKNESILRLQLNDQKMGPAGYEELGKALGENGCLRAIGLANTAAEGESFQAFLKVVDNKNVCLKEMDVTANKGLVSNREWEGMLTKVHFTIQY